MLDEWRKCRRMKAGGRCKVIVMTNVVPVMAAYSALLRVEYGDAEVANLDATMTRREKDDALEAFKKIDGPWILMAKLDTVKMSLNLQRANKTLLLEPIPKESTLRQAKARSV